MATWGGSHRTPSWRWQDDRARPRDTQQSLVPAHKCTVAGGPGQSALPGSSTDCALIAPRPNQGASPPIGPPNSRGPEALLQPGTLLAHTDRVHWVLSFGAQRLRGNCLQGLKPQAPIQPLCTLPTASVVPRQGPWSGPSSDRPEPAVSGLTHLPPTPPRVLPVVESVGP